MVRPYYDMNKGKIFIILITFVEFYSSNPAIADAIWPFNTPKFEASLICRNAANQAEHAAESRSMMSINEWLEEFNSAEWKKPEHYLDRREYIHAVRTAYKNPNVSPSTISKIVIEDCEARKGEIIAEIKKRNERK